MRRSEALLACVRLADGIYHKSKFIIIKNRRKGVARRAKKRHLLGVQGMLVFVSAARREDDAGDRLSPSWRSVLRSRRRLAGRQPDDVVDSTGWVLLSMDEDGDPPPPPPSPRLHSAMLPAGVHTLAS